MRPDNNHEGEDSWPEVIGACLLLFILLILALI